MSGAVVRRSCPAQLSGADVHYGCPLQIDVICISGRSVTVLMYVQVMYVSAFLWEIISSDDWWIVCNVMYSGLKCKLSGDAPQGSWSSINDVNYSGCVLLLSNSYICYNFVPVTRIVF